MKSLWKSLWMGCALLGLLAGAVGCGPQRAFCPNIGNGGVCPIEGDDAHPMGGNSGGSITCDAGFIYVLGSNNMFSCQPITN
jgi:hypothetical protein